MIGCIDENLGRLRKHLATSDLDRNTILVFLNDNGTGHGVLLKKNGKSNRSGWPNHCLPAVSVLNQGHYLFIIKDDSDNALVQGCRSRAKIFQ